MHGRDIAQDTIKERAERIGFVMQNPNHMISKTLLYDEVALGLRLRDCPEELVRERVHQVLKVCGLYFFAAGRSRRSVTARRNGSRLPPFWYWSRK